MISSWLRLIAATLVAGVFVLALVSRGHSQICTTVAPSEARDCLKFDVTCGNNRVNLIWGPYVDTGRIPSECGSGVYWEYDCFYNNSKAGSGLFQGSASGSREYSISNGEYCVYYACVDIHTKYYLLSNGTVTCTVPSQTSTFPSTTSTGTIPTYPLSSESHTTIFSTTFFPTSSSDWTSVPSSSVNDTVPSTTGTGITPTYSEINTTISSTTFFPTSSSDLTSVPSSLVTVISTSSSVNDQQTSVSSVIGTEESTMDTSLLPSLNSSLTASPGPATNSNQTITMTTFFSSVIGTEESTMDTSPLPSLNSSLTASPGPATNPDQTITIATIVTVGITIAVVILIGLWIKMTRRNKKQLQELIFYDKIEVGALVFIETKSKSLVTLTESLEPVELSGSLRPIIIHGQENEANPPPAYSETEDMFCSAIKDTLPSQEQTYLTSLSDENGDLTFVEGVPTQTDDVVSVNSYLDTASPPQQQHQQLYNTTLSGIDKETASFNGSSISEMFESDGLRTSSDTEQTCARFSMIERDDGYLATT